MSRTFFTDLLEKYPSAVCAQTEPELFFPEKGSSNRDGKKLCASCVHITECGLDAIERGEQFGIWGGLSERERRVIFREMKKAAA